MTIPVVADEDWIKPVKGGGDENTHEWVFHSDHEIQERLVTA